MWQIIAKLILIFICQCWVYILRLALVVVKVLLIHLSSILIFILYSKTCLNPGADPGFQVRGCALKKNCAERREVRKFLGYFVWKITILCQKIIFLPILGGGAHPCKPNLLDTSYIVQKTWVGGLFMQVKLIKVPALGLYI